MNSERLPSPAPVSLAHAVRHGTRLGCMATLYGSGVLVALLWAGTVWSYALLAYRDNYRLSLWNGLVEGVVYGMMWLLATGPLFLVAGAINALLQWIVLRLLRAPRAVSLAVGTAMGICVGLVLMEISLRFNPFGYRRGLLSMHQGDLQELAVILTVAAGIGIWHGWQMARYVSGSTQAGGV